MNTFLSRPKRKEITTTQLAIAASLFWVICCNAAFFRHVVQVYPVSWKNIWFLLSLAVGMTALMTCVIAAISSRYTIKFFLILLFLVSSMTAYFMDNFDIVIDKAMIRSIVDTSQAEVTDLVSLKMVGYFLFLGVLPSLFVYKANISSCSFRRRVITKMIAVYSSILILLLIVVSFSKFYTSFFRENESLRYYANPEYYIYSSSKYLKEKFSDSDSSIYPIGVDAKIVSSKDRKKKVIILVVGEAARADHFSLNGYAKETNPLLKQEDVINFSQMYSCGTSTAYSIPCMFSSFTRSEYSEKKGKHNENVLDILHHTGAIEILWRDNNSDSKGVAARVAYEDYQKPENNPVCGDGECRDEGMLSGLDRYIEEHKEKDILIVLHQMGNHGPAYYKRYPKEFEVFNPICATNQLEECSNEEIVNTYDNALRYTDYFLSRVISLLKKEDQQRETAMIYISDHGESLGENGLYLHGLPYTISPESQRHIGAVMWLGEGMSRNLDLGKIRSKKNEQYSHDNLFHTLLGIFDVQTKEYRKDMDMLHD
jgi:lipid A ethanolaminephosphotransferase